MIHDGSSLLWLNYYILVGVYENDYRTGEGQRYHSSQQTVSLQAQEQNADQREREAEELRALERYSTNNYVI